uniref:Putative secreted protein n=1 Tax=Ixodes ricinus TaxID=34613 RepID=A0A6B0TXC8_IXORI
MCRPPPLLTLSLPFTPLLLIGALLFGSPDYTQPSHYNEREVKLKMENSNLSFWFFIYICVDDYHRPAEP